MAQEDKIKWNKKYQEKPELLKKRKPSSKLVQIIDQIKGDKVLEIACGTGRNSIFLAQKGFNIDALDISEVALEHLNSKGFANIKTKIVDLEEYTPEQNSYDLIVKTNYLERKLIAPLLKALKEDGIILIETYMDHPDNQKQSSNPDFLLKKGELKSFFNDDFQIIEYEEFNNEDYEIFKMRKQSIIAKKIR